ncbi:MAG: PAS domain S-box protein, partial [Anaerolineales bacterium]|nr:PAS domain S-box protein [Anaerolineales bacterium]
MNNLPQTNDEGLLQALFDKATEGMFIVSPAGAILKANAASCQHTGYGKTSLLQLSLFDLFPETAPTPNIQFQNYTLRQQDGRLHSVTIETRPLVNGRFLLILHHPSEQTEAKQKIVELTETVQTINDLAIRLNGLLVAPKPIQQIATIIQDIPGVFAVTVSSYLPETRELLVEHVALPAAERKILSRINKIIGRPLIGMRLPVSDEMHQRMFNELVAAVGTLHEVTFGEIPKPVSALFHRTFRVDKLHGLALIENNDLLGTVVIAMRRDAEPLTQEVRVMLSRVCAIALRRAHYDNELKTSVAKFRSYIEHAPVGIFVVDKNGRYLETNQAAVKMLGYSEAELLQLTISDIVHPDYLSTGLAHFQSVLREGHASGEYCLLPKDGSMLWATVEAAKLNDDALIAFVLDITARKKAERNSQLKDELLQLTGEMAKVGGWQFDTATGEGTWTPEIAHIHELDPNDAATVSLGLSFYPPEARQQIEQAIEAAIHHGTPYDLELPLVSAKGRHKWIRTMAVPIWKDGKVVEVRGIFQDITESKKAEQALLEQVSLQNQLAQVAATVPGMICSFKMDLEGHVTMPYTGPSLEDVFGLSAEALAEDASGLLANVHPDDLAYVNQTIAESAEMMKPWRAEYRYRHPQKGERWIGGHSMPQKQADGSMLWHGFVQDITERKEAEKEQVQLETNLRQMQKMDSIGRLAGGVAHDFNNLLTVIQMYSDLMAAQMRPGDPLLPKLAQIQRASERASELTRQLLAFSRKQIMNTAVVSLNELILHLQKMLGRLIGEDIDLSVSLQPDLWNIKADPGQIEQVIMNLVVNARDAMPTGGLLTVETRNVLLDESFLTSQLKTPTGPCVMLAISDTGHGMDEATKQRIFEPFFTTKEAGTGTGLGLATVHGVVQQSGGSIFVYSEPNNGSTFKVYLPASEDTMPEVS